MKKGGGSISVRRRTLFILKFLDIIKNDNINPQPKPINIDTMSSSDPIEQNPNEN